jgi:signal transduction histidine kinase/CheY-like chemotaxis protein
MAQSTVKLAIALVAAACIQAQDVVTLEQASTYEGRVVTVRAQIAASPIWAAGFYYLPLRDSSDYGLILRGDHDRFYGYEPGDWIEAHGRIESRAGLPLLMPDSMERVRQGPRPAPKSMPLSDAASRRWLGLIAETRGTITKIDENAAGTIVQLTDRGTRAAAFLPRSQSPNDLLTRIRVGDRVTASGLLTESSGNFQILLAQPGDLKASFSAQRYLPLAIITAVILAAIFLLLNWLRNRRLTAQHNSTKVFHTLCEEIIAAPSPAEIADKLMTVLPTITQATGAWLYIFNRRTKSLERVPTEGDPEPVVVPVESQPDLEHTSEALASGAAVCFENRKQVNIPDVRRSSYLNTRTKQQSPRSAIIVPLSTQGDVLGVLEAGNANSVGYFTIGEQASIQHLANQVAAALKLQEQRTIREQLFRSEKLAATGQLISGVANELRAPLEVILHLSLALATELAGRESEHLPERDLRLLAAESRRASEIVSRLVSFAQPEDSETRRFDVNAMLAELIQFREPEWKALELRLQNRLAPEPAFIIGAQGQIEQVFLNLLVHAEQSAAEMPAKTVAISTSVIAGRALVEIGYSARADKPEDGDNDSGALSLGVCRTIVHNHGGLMRFSTRAGLATFEVELPVDLRTEDPSASRNAAKSERALTIMLVDPDPGPQRQLLGLLSVRGHRVVPVAPEEAAEVAQRLRFDAVFWAMRLTAAGGGVKWSEFRERARSSIATFVLVSDGYDIELARSIEEGGSFLLGRPIQQSELDRILRHAETRTPVPTKR